MPNTTRRALPYPDPSMPARDGAANIQALAEALDANRTKIADTPAHSTAASGGTTNTAVVFAAPFPAGITPAVVIQNIGNTRLNYTVLSVTNTGFTLQTTNWTAAAANGVVSTYVAWTP
jgi:hypothetical protein